MRGTDSGLLSTMATSRACRYPSRLGCGSVWKRDKEPLRPIDAHTRTTPNPQHSNTECPKNNTPNKSSAFQNIYCQMVLFPSAVNYTRQERKHPKVTRLKEMSSVPTKMTSRVCNFFKTENPPRAPSLKSAQNVLHHLGDCFFFSFSLSAAGRWRNLLDSDKLSAKNAN
jgi:hypothetical protein